MNKIRISGVSEALQSGQFNALRNAYCTIFTTACRVHVKFAV